MLVCPTEWKGGIEKPLLAYDGSQRSASAMQAAADFCVTLSLPLTVAHVARDEAPAAPASSTRPSATSPRTRCRRRSPVSPATPRAIVATLRSDGHDLLFIGAYGHSRIVEMVLGSTTEYVLRNAPCPIFLNR